LLRSLPRRLAGGRPAIAWSLSLIFLFKGLVALTTVAFPIASGEPTRLVAVVGGVAVLAALGIWLFGRRISLLGFELLTAMGALVVSAMVAQATTHGGMMVAAFSYPWVAIYAAHFFPRRAVIAIGLLISVGFGVGILLGGLSHWVIYWVVVSVTTTSICLVLGRLSEALRRQADTDPLTGLLNRSGFQVAANREHAIAQRTGNPLTLAVIDLDGFKQINDQRGHLVGDRLLADLGRSWSERLRAGDILARHGGDEFVLLLPATSPAGAGAILERLHVDELPVSWSVGIGQWESQESLSECIARADTDLYSVKNALGLRPVRSIELASSTG
jgi:diguanylate cyclase (GGDEF)-like protein